MELLGRIVILHLTFGETAKLFSTAHSHLQIFPSILCPDLVLLASVALQGLASIREMFISLREGTKEREIFLENTPLCHLTYSSLELTEVGGGC